MVSNYYTWSNIKKGAIIYPVGDTIAALILGEFSIYRMLGIMFVGSTFYAVEIPNYFLWINRKVPEVVSNFANSIKRTILAILYFNPIWITRHLFFINIFSGNWDQINYSLFSTSVWSFLIAMPVVLPANYIIQNKLSYRWRFIGSSVFSGLMVIYFALSKTLLE
uniref:Uncharacterized protein n=1 Tax=Candidatus Kentrum sp. TUN TaxID=2126343 RepID=A0A451AEI9_9GAMM|nr:MAG: hypothetical protein BECKTUN1418D_GA0071000_12653 [Candidatus Kentron sp. TUN]